MKKVIFLVNDKDGNELHLAVLRPNNALMLAAQQVYNKAFRDAVESGAFLRVEIDRVSRERGLWTDEQENALSEVIKKLNELELKLKRGGMSKKQGRELAIQMKILRATLIALYSQKNVLENNTAEAQADNAKFNFLVSECTVYNNKERANQRVFADVDDYISRGNDPESQMAAGKLAQMISGWDEDSEKKLPENAFLLKYNFVDSNLRYINKDGKFVNIDNELVDEKGRRINEDGKFIDVDGNEIDENGQYIVEEQPFYDDEE